MGICMWLMPTIGYYNEFEDIQFSHISEAIGYRNLDREGWGGDVKNKGCQFVFQTGSLYFFRKFVRQTSTYYFDIE